ncbi:MAG TPA: MarR family transcriptional regulator [Baekduia sp.]|uniref:MarR family winged helix-turn-helix transcriptional regulator n=1 Tax=Baekduia sp. TaxID=2600305 RepID=UPI002CA9C4C0|nr:MarR family transcriptional regulator [Baekduia sp.]HMJ32389.1 MarR family transcriptional regulator [Baekduia sp.]
MSARGDEPAGAVGAAQAPENAGTEDVRLAFIELLGAERRGRARDQKCGPGELTQTQIRALFKLDSAGESTAGDLAKAAELSPASVSAMLDHLERDGIVERSRSASDRRVVVVSLTASGRALLAEKRERWRARGREALAGVSQKDLHAAADVMRRMAAMLDDL